MVRCVRVALIVAAVAVSAGCKKKPEYAVVQRVVLSLPQSMDNDASAREKLRTDILAQLALDDLTRVTEEDSEATHLVRVEVTRVLDPVAREESPGVVVQLRSFSKGAVLEAVGRSDARGGGPHRPR